MLIVFTSNWWALALRGLAAVSFGLLAFLWPHITLAALVLLFGAYALVDGAFAIVAGIRAPREMKRWWLLLIEGILSIFAGVMAFTVPGITALILLGLIAGWALVTGVIQIAAAIQMRKYIRGEWLLVLSGIASVLFGILMLFNPGAGALAVVWLIGAYAVVSGVLLLSLGFKLRSLVRVAHQMTPRTV
jgi:uncharacterized membrane protein HdeD (DUF308 family)